MELVKQETIHDLLRLKTPNVVVGNAFRPPGPFATQLGGGDMYTIAWVPCFDMRSLDRGRRVPLLQRMRVGAEGEVSWCGVGSYPVSAVQPVFVAMHSMKGAPDVCTRRKLGT